MSTSIFTLYVTYYGDPQSRFDRDYYVNSHIPLVIKAFQPYGLLSAAALFPAVEQAGTVAIAECVFRDEEAMKAAFNSPEAPEVTGDVPHFTDLTPSMLRAVAL
ncbi:EthD family reductase [Kosakonia cowanii]|uniref:EthD family reductase n=1 Tax=Kosakonia cowanii TaxID=208223 RepID=UPI0039A5C7ED